MLAIEQSHPDYYEFYWDEQDIKCVERDAYPWTFTEMLMRAIDLEDGEPKRHIVGDDGKSHPDTGELDRLRDCIDDRLRSAARAVVGLRGPTNSARRLTPPWVVVSTTGPRWAHRERERIREILEPSD